MIDWTSRESHLLLNPRLPAEERERLERLHASAPPLEGHVWMATSGTTGSMRLVALSKGALLTSAEAVNRHLDARSTDVWCCVLPTFHVGGLGILARAALSGSRIDRFEWDPARFASGGFTLASLVPAQVRDLVRGRLPAPAGVRAVVVGGGALPEELHAAGGDLGWPLLPSYGLTEAASQVATARPGDPVLRILSHLEARSDEGRIAIRGGSLLTGYLFEADGEARFADPKTDGWFVTEDRGEVEGRTLRVSGRGGEFVKIGGESVDLGRLDKILEEVRGEADAAVVAVRDERLGHVIHLAVATGEPETVRAAFNSRVLPYERARAAWRVAEIPRTALGKLRRGELATRIGPAAG